MLTAYDLSEVRDLVSEDRYRRLLVEDRPAADIVLSTSGASSAMLEDATEAAVAITAICYPPLVLGTHTLPTIVN